MKVKVIHNRLRELSDEAIIRLSHSMNYDLDHPIDALTIGKIHAVQAIGRWEKQVNYYIQRADSDTYPVPIPAEFFVVLDSSIPTDWCVGTTNRDRFTEFLISFPAWSQDLTFYEKLLAGDTIIESLYKKYKIPL